MKIKMWGLLSHVLVLVLEWVRNVHLVQRSIPARVAVTTFTLRVRKRVVVFPVHIESGGAVLTVVIRSPVMSKFIARHMIIIITIILLPGF
jgi:hypothetical protein